MTIYETVVVNYKIGVCVDEYEVAGTLYKSVNYGGSNAVVRSAEAVPLTKYLGLLRDAEFEICSWCNGNKYISPIDNPPYQCDHCSGRGWFVRKE